MSLSYSPCKIVFDFKFEFELSLSLSALSSLYIFIYLFLFYFFTHTSLPSPSGLSYSLGVITKVQENVQTVCIFKCSLKQHRPTKTAAQTTTFRSELRSSVKVEVAVPGSRP